MIRMHENVKDDNWTDDSDLLAQAMVLVSQLEWASQNGYPEPLRNERSRLRGLADEIQHRVFELAKLQFRVASLIEQADADRPDDGSDRRF